MTQRYVFVLAGLIVLAAVSLFNIKYAVVAAEGEIARMEQQIEAERWLLRTLEADWAHLARAERLAAQTLYGAGKLLHQTQEAPEDLRAKVTSKGGTTEAAIKAFDKHGLAEVLRAGVHASATRSRELGSQLE